MKAVITVLGKDTVGIIAKMSAECAKYGVNIIDITQKVLDDMFVMIMIVDIKAMTVKFTEFVDVLDSVGTDMGLDVHTMHEDIFNAMHNV